MSDTQFKLIDTSNGIEKTFDSRSAAEEKKQELDGLGGPYEIQRVSENGNGAEAVETPTQPTDDVDVVDHTEQSEPAPAPEPQTDDTEQSLPARELTDDPIEWLQNGDGELTTSIKGTTVITKKGFRVLQHHYDISTGSEVVVGPEDTDHEFCRVKAWAEMPDGRRAEANASAHVDRGDDSFLLTSMADTRAKSRALSDVTGVGAVAIEEMAGVAND